jgi:hypothetical protein
MPARGRAGSAPAQTPPRAPGPAAGYESCAPRVLRVLERLVNLRDVSPDYTYYGIASPWLQVRRGQTRPNAAEAARKLGRRSGRHAESHAESVQLVA